MSHSTFPLLLGAASSVSLSVAVVGFVVGALIAARNRTADPNLPLGAGVICGAVAYMVAEVLILIVTLAIVLGLIFAVIRYRPAMERMLDTFAQACGRRFTTRRFTGLGNRITREHSQRQAFFDSLPVDHKNREQLRKEDAKRFCDDLDKLGRLYPYVPDENHDGRSETLTFEDHFHRE